MSRVKPINLRDLEYSPSVNPLMEPRELRVKRRYVRTRGGGQELVNSATGELVGMAIVHTVEDRDDAEFVKVFAEGVRLAFELTRTGYRVFQAVLNIYQGTSMRGGYAEAVEVFWFGDGLNGEKLDMSEKTFQRGLKELLTKGFLAPKSSSLFWINPSLFFKGDRVAFVREYRRRSPVILVHAEPSPNIECVAPDLPARDPRTVDFLHGRADIEDV